MFDWFYNKEFLEHQEVLFIVSISVIILMIIVTGILVYREIGRSKC